jgi:hypothetical protein
MTLLYAYKQLDGHGKIRCSHVIAQVPKEPQTVTYRPTSMNSGSQKDSDLTG